jgi:hypothetical protein
VIRVCQAPTLGRQLLFELLGADASDKPAILMKRWPYVCHSQDARNE